MSIKNNTTRIQDILTKIHNLPEAGTDLPELSNEAVASELLSGKQLIDDEGNVVTGTMSNNGAINKTMDGINTKSITISKGYTTGGTVSLDNTIDNEVNTQGNLMSQIKTVLAGKAAGGGTTLPTLTNEGSADELLSGKQLINSAGKIVNGTFTIENELDTQEDLISQIATAVNNLPEAGGGGGTSGGVCPQLTIKGTANESIQMGICFYSTNNIYTCANSDGLRITELILNNVDINTPVTLEIVDNIGMFDGMTGTNAEYLTGNGYIMSAKCTAAGENSVIQLKESELWGPGG